MKKIVTLLVAAAFIAGTVLPVSAGERNVRNSPGNNAPERKKVGLVLSGGGAKGVAHVGVIKVLEEAEIPIDYIAGTSMGAIVGGLYSIGYTTHELDSLLRNQDWVFLLSDKISRTDKLLTEKEVSDTYLLSMGLSLDRKFSLPSGAVAGQNVLNLLNELTIGYHDEDLDYNDMPIPFACVAYDMVEGKEVVFRDGNLPTAIRASMSIPGAFAPIIKDSMVLVDGGIYNNFPVDVVREMGAEIIIGVDLFGGAHDLEGLNSIMGIVDQITTFLGREQYKKNCDSLDLHLRPNIKPYTSASFNPEAIDTLLARGEAVARERWDDIVDLKSKICVDDYCDIAPRRMRIMENDSVRVGNIHFAGMSRNEENLIRPSLRIKEHSTITKAELNNGIARLRGSGAFSYVTYTLDSQPPYDMIISVDEKQQASVNVGFRFDSEEMASILLNTKLNFRGLQGPQLGVTIRLNDNPYAKLHFTSSSWFLGRLGISYMYKHNNYRLFDSGQRSSSVTFGQHRLEAYFLVANPSKFTVNAGLRYEYFNYNSFLFASEKDFLAVEPQGYLNYFLTTRLETFNNRYYPTKGMHMRTDLMVHTDNGYGHDGGLPFISFYYNISGAIRIYERLIVIPTFAGRTVAGNSIAYPYLNYMGGEIAGRYMDQQLPFVGVSNVETFSRSLMTLQVELRQRIFSRNYLSIKAGYAIHNNDFFNMFTDRNGVFGLGIKYSYDSPIGPISLQVDHSDLTPKGVGVYFSLGKNF